MKQPIIKFVYCRMIAGSHIQVATGQADLLGGLNFGSGSGILTPNRTGTPAPIIGSNQPFDAVIAIGVLIKGWSIYCAMIPSNLNLRLSHPGATMHFEYICDAVSHSLMKIQVDTGVPVIFGVLTALNDDQALERAGLGKGEKKGHNHGEEWGLAAVEMGSHVRRWSSGKFL